MYVGVSPVVLADAEVVEHRLGAQEARRERDGGDAVPAQLLGLRPRQSDHRVLGEVVEEVAAVVLPHAVGDLHDQAAPAADHQRHGRVARDQVRVHRLAQQLQPVVERVLPERHAPPGERVAAPDVVHEHVEAPVLLARDALDQTSHLVRARVVHANRDAAAARRVHQLGRLLDRLRAAHRRAAGPGAAAAHINAEAGPPELDGDAAAGPPRSSCDQCDAFHERNHPALEVGHPGCYIRHCDGPLV